ncbi:MAG: hypothetical protein RR489_07250 [Clostridia bacterium]
MQQIKNTKDVVEEYFKKNNIENLMEYASDSAHSAAFSITDVYKELMQELNIKYINIYSEDISDGKFSTNISFGDTNEINIQTNAWDGKEIVEENLKLIKAKYMCKI